MSLEPDQQYAPPPSSPPLSPEKPLPKATSCQTIQNDTKRYDDAVTELSPLQQQAMALMLAGQRDTVIAQRMKIGRMTLWRWRNRNNVFRTTMRELSRGQWAVSEARISRTVSEALGLFTKRSTATTTTTASSVPWRWCASRQG